MGVTLSLCKRIAFRETGVESLRAERVTRFIGIL